MRKPTCVSLLLVKERKQQIWLHSSHLLNKLSLSISLCRFLCSSLHCLYHETAKLPSKHKPNHTTKHRREPRKVTKQKCTLPKASWTNFLNKPQQPWSTKGSKNLRSFSFCVWNKCNNSISYIYIILISRFPMHLSLSKWFDLIWSTILVFYHK